MRRYFNTGVEPLAVRAPIYGIEQDVFNEREIAHMYDVKRLVRGTYWVAVGSFLWIIATLAAGFTLQRREYTAPAARLAVWSGAVTLLAVVAVGLASIAAFEQLFLLFHHLSFANDLWILNPHTDYLLILFPGGFWFDATMRVALTSVLGAILLLSAGCAILGYQRWRTQPANGDCGMTRQLKIQQPFNLELTLTMGQAFRWRKLPADFYGDDHTWFSGVIGENLIHIRQTAVGVEYRVGGADGERPAYF